MKKLLDDRFAPITGRIGFLQTTMERLADCVLASWRRISRPGACDYFHADLATALARLEPLNEPRVLLVDTASEWTAVFRDDTLPLVDYVSSVLRCPGVCATCNEDTYDIKTGRGTPGSVQLFVFAGVQDLDHNYRRTISVTNQLGRWHFDQSYQPLPFEDVQRYRARRVRDRFTPEMLDRYCQAMGIRPFDHTFYGPRCGLIYPARPLPADFEPLTYEKLQAQRNLGPSQG
ncbi:MAG TPA: hypothetical protein EYP04_11095 [Anaerolineae bacterium]|nr:hypothetical protein [Anaerolineae bacterium]